MGWELRHSYPSQTPPDWYLQIRNQVPTLPEHHWILYSAAPSTEPNILCP
jgi:hypothetical protein